MACKINGVVWTLTALCAFASFDGRDAFNPEMLCKIGTCTYMSYKFASSSFFFFFFFKNENFKVFPLIFNLNMAQGKWDLGPKCCVKKM